MPLPSPSPPLPTGGIAALHSAGPATGVGGHLAPLSVPSTAAPRGPSPRATVPRLPRAHMTPPRGHSAAAAIGSAATSAAGAHAAAAAAGPVASRSHSFDNVQHAASGAVGSPNPGAATAPLPSSQYVRTPQVGRRILVTGGSGFCGRHLIQTLLGLGHDVHCFDSVSGGGHDPCVKFFHGDITADLELLSEACEDVDTIFHAASLTNPVATYKDIQLVNVQGTRNVLDAAVAQGVRNFIYLSTTAVIFQGRDICGLSEEECPYPQRYLDSYAASKADAEKLVVAANGSVSPLTGEALCTISLRPHAIFGPRDVHFMAKLVARAREGTLTHRIGSGTNLVAWTYVGNVIHACVLAMNRMSRAVSALEHPTGRAGSFNAPLAMEHMEEGVHEETDEEEASSEPAEEGEHSEAESTASRQHTASWSQRGSPYHSPAASRLLTSDELARRHELGGQCFFITNGAPRPFWGFLQLLLNESGCIAPHKSISFRVAYLMACIMETIRWIWERLRPFTNRPTMDATLTRHMVCVMARTQYFNIDKAKRLLGYEPLIALERGLEYTIGYFFRKRTALVSHWNGYNGIMDAMPVSVQPPAYHAHSPQLVLSRGHTALVAAVSVPTLPPQALLQHAHFPSPAAALLPHRHSSPSPDEASLAHAALQHFPLQHHMQQQHYQQQQQQYSIMHAGAYRPPLARNPSPSRVRHHLEGGHMQLAQQQPQQQPQQQMQQQQQQQHSNGAHSPPVLLPPPTRRGGMQQLPSSLWLNAYAQPPTAAAVHTQQQLHGTSPGSTHAH